MPNDKYLWNPEKLDTEFKPLPGAEKRWELSKVRRAARDKISLLASEEFSDFDLASNKAAIKKTNELAKVPDTKYLSKEQAEKYYKDELMDALEDHAAGALGTAAGAIMLPALGSSAAGAIAAKALPAWAAQTGIELAGGAVTGSLGAVAGGAVDKALGGTGKLGEAIGGIAGAAPGAKVAGKLPKRTLKWTSQRWALSNPEKMGDQFVETQPRKQPNYVNNGKLEYLDKDGNVDFDKLESAVEKEKDLMERKYPDAKVQLYPDDWWSSEVGDPEDGRVIINSGQMNITDNAKALAELIKIRATKNSYPGKAKISITHGTTADREIGKSITTQHDFIEGIDELSKTPVEVFVPGNEKSLSFAGVAHNKVPHVRVDANRNPASSQVHEVYGHGAEESAFDRTMTVGRNEFLPVREMYEKVSNPSELFGDMSELYMTEASMNPGEARASNLQLLEEMLEEQAAKRGMTPLEFIKQSDADAAIKNAVDKLTDEELVDKMRGKNAYLKDYADNLELADGRDKRIYSARLRDMLKYGFGLAPAIIGISNESNSKRTSNKDHR